MGCVGGELFYSRLDKLGLKLDVRVSPAEFLMTKINKFSLEGPLTATFDEYILFRRHIYLPWNVFSILNNFT